MKARVFIATALLAPMAISCVSKRNYEELESRNQTLQRELMQTESALNQAQEARKQTQLESSAKLAAKEGELEEREKRLAELEALVNEQKMAVQALHQEVCSALKCFTPDELKIDVRNGKLYVSLSEELLFPSGKATINERGNEAIDMLAVVLKNSNLEIMVEGHTDNVPIKTAKYPDNWALSVDRANAVTRKLADNGIDPQRIISSGRGEYMPIASNATEEGRAANRRTEIVLSPRLDRLWKLTETENLNAELK